MALNSEALDDLKTILDRPGDDLELRIVEDETTDKVSASWWATVQDLDTESQIMVGQFDIRLLPASDETIYEVLNFVPRYQNAGFYYHMIRYFPDWTRGQGCPNWVVPVVVNSNFYNSLRDTGFEPVAESTALTADVSDPDNSKPDQFNNWLHGSAPEPDWHQELPDDERVSRK